MNVRQVAFLLFASVGLWSISATTDAQQLQIRGPKSNTAELSGTTYGPVVPEDTLWRIASRYRQNKNLSVYQVMQAIYQLNPDAFEDQNFNHLVDGSILQLPSERYVARIDPKVAQMKAEQDDSAWQAFSKGETDKVVVRSSKEAASKDDLSETKQVIEDKLSALDAEQNRQFTAIRQQFAESIESVQSLLNENRKLVERLDTVDIEISSLRGRVDEELQVQMDQMLALQNELLAISREAENQRKAELEKNSFAWLTDPLFLIFLSVLLTISLLGALAMWLIRRKRTEAETDAILDENHAAILEQSDEMDDLADALTNELSEELDDSDDDDLFGDDDLLDDVLAEELEESLDADSDDNFEAFDDLDDESLDPVIEESTDDIAKEDNPLEDDLDNLFDEEEDLLADIGDELGESDSLAEAKSDDVLADDELDLSESNLDVSADDELSEEIADLDIDTSENDVEQIDSDSKAADLDAESSPSISAPDIDDEPDKPEISIDELLEQPLAEEDGDSIISDNSDLMNEEMLQSIDKEIHQQNAQLDNITDELLNEIEQLEQMGGMLEEQPETPADDESTESQMGIQELDSLSESIEDDDDISVDVDDGEELDIADELFDAIEDSETEANVDSEIETSAEVQPTEDLDVGISNDNQIDENQNIVDVDDIDDLLNQQSVDNSSVESLSADELLAEIEADKQQPADEAVKPETDVQGQSEEPVVEQSQQDINVKSEDVEQVQDIEEALDVVEEQQNLEETEHTEEDLTAEQSSESDTDINKVENHGIEDLDKALDEFEQEVVSEATSFDVELDDETLSSASEDLDDMQLEQIIPPEKDDDIEKVLSGFDEEIPSIDDIDSLTGEDSDGFDDDDLDEALKAFDEGYLDEQDTQTEKQPSEKRENVELDDLPGLGDWLSSDDAEETNSLDELENTSFDELLDSLDSSEIDAPENSPIVDKDPLANIDSGLDFDALLNDIDDAPGQTKETVTEEKSEDDFLDVDDLINESIEAEGTLDIDKELNLAAAFESYEGFGEADEVDVDSDNGIGAKLDLAQAYLETDDIDSAKELLEEVLQKGDQTQQEEAKELLEKLA
ncbi:FimV/HubP family polar landmark protein [Alteromonas sp. M12]|uniref:FimV/HubP family polar landmark protein n=1 Tax=Alteromonas sp. M12 TaxID=3135644 RepID=UPI00319DD3C5